MLVRPRTAQVRRPQIPKNPKARARNRKPKPRKKLPQLNPNLHPHPRVPPNATRRLRAGAQPFVSLFHPLICSYSARSCLHMAGLCHFQIEVVSVAFFCKTLNAGCSKVSEARRAKFDELRRTLKYVEASRANATRHMRFFQQPARFVS
jgi:hypothetical protein